MEGACLGKALILYIEISFEKYQQLWQRFRQHETVFTKAEFDYQSTLFDVAFNECSLTKTRLINDGTFDDLVTSAHDALKQVFG